MLSKKTVEKVIGDSSLISSLGFKKFILFRQFILDKEYPEYIVTAVFPKYIKVQEKGQQFLTLVKEGKQAEVEAMLQEYSWLANYKGNVTDLSERYFAGITGFQCAVWDRDWHMYSMCLKYMQTDDVCRQLRDMETGSWVAEHGMFASWQNLIDAIDKFIELYKTHAWGAALAQWYNVVREAQLSLPAHVVNEYCHPTRSFVPCPDFKDGSPLPRVRIMNNEEDWFKCLKDAYRNRGGCAGAVVRMAGQVAWLCSTRLAMSLVRARAWEEDCLPDDRHALAALLEIREAQCNQLFTDHLGSECTSRIKFKS